MDTTCWTARPRQQRPVPDEHVPARRRRIRDGRIATSLPGGFVSVTHAPAGRSLKGQVQELHRLPGGFVSATIRDVDETKRQPRGLVSGTLLPVLLSRWCLCGGVVSVTPRIGRARSEAFVSETLDHWA